jgi:hypothetical protein
MSLFGIEPDSYFDREGNPMTLFEWAEAFRDPAQRVVAKSFVPAGVDDVVEVSTVWLGLNHAFMGGMPLIFETMVFGGKLDGEMNRYASENGARQGHKDMVLRVEAVER